MGYTNSSMVVYTKLSPNHSGQRTHGIDRITPYCVVGQLSCESICGCFTSPSVQASCNYGIGEDGRVSLCVEEKNRSWCSSSNANDQRAVTIECASGRTEPYEMSTAVYASLVRLCIDICRRNGKNKLIWFGDKDKTLNYTPKSGEMILTVHQWFANKSCPGDWLYARLSDLAEKVTAALQGADSGGSDPDTPEKVKWYRVRKSWTGSKSQKGAYKILDNAKKCADQNPGCKVYDEDGKVVYEPETAKPAVKVPFLVKVSISDLNIRTGPGTGYARVQFIPAGVYTIVEVKDGKRSEAGWGRLKSGAGWIALEFVERV